MDVLAFSLGEFWVEWLRPIALLIVGLGGVILVHELGHFIVAKLVGIRVERFALGFGPRLFGYRGKETDYCVNLLPLGGYVKMLGQEDFKPLADGETRDPRAFTSKSVGARFAVISAGVIMNVIFAALLFIVVCLAGIQFNAPVVGGVTDAYPAKQATIRWLSGPLDAPEASDRLRPGDHIQKVDGKEITRFEQLYVTAALAEPDDTFHMTIRRPTPRGDLIGTTEIGVKDRDSPSGSGASILAFGIIRPADTVLGAPDDVTVADSLREGDRVVAVGDRPIKHQWEIAELQKTLQPRATTLTVERQGRRVTIDVHPALVCPPARVILLKDGGRVGVEEVLKVDEKGRTVRTRGGEKRRIDNDEMIEDFLLDILGCQPRVRLTGVSEDSPAEGAGLRPGDIILVYGDRSAPSYAELVEVNKEMVDTATNLVVLRDGGIVDGLSVVPKTRQGRALIGIQASVDMAHPVLADVRKNSPADKARIRPGDVLVKVTAVAEEASSRGAARAASGPAGAAAGDDADRTRRAERQVRNWGDFFLALEAFRGRVIEITVRRGSNLQQARIGRLTPDIFDPADYRSVVFDTPRPFRPLLGPVVRKGPIKAIGWGVEETWLFILRTYATLRSLLKRTISTKELIGPVGMGGVAIQVGRESITKLIYFMAMISVSLAVINFLPIPVVDGGHAVFLIIEKIRGKPVPVKIMNIVQMAGLALLLFVFVAITWQDISRLASGLW